MEEQEQQIHILIVEDHELVAEGLKSLLETQRDFKVIGTAKDKEEALQCCHSFTKLDLILMDVELSNQENGLNLTPLIKEKFKGKFPKLKVLMCTVYGELSYKQRARQLGADGFITKSGTSSRELLHLIRRVQQGGDYWTKTVPPEPSPELPPPTPTELKILKYIERGMQSAQIGIELAMPEANVAAHRHHMMQKWRFKTQGELFKHASNCMRLYGSPPDCDLSKELRGLINKFGKGLKIKFNGKTSKEDGDVKIAISGRRVVFKNYVNNLICRLVDVALRNIKQHGQAREVCIRFELANSSRLILTVQTDAVGFDIGEEKTRLERLLAAIGGELLTDSPAGTTVTATLPLRDW